MPLLSRVNTLLAMLLVGWTCSTSASGDLIETMNGATGTGGVSSTPFSGAAWDDGISDESSFSGIGGGTTFNSGSASATLDGGVTGNIGDHAASVTLNPSHAGGGFWFGGLIFEGSGAASSIDPNVMSLTADILAPNGGEFNLRVEQPGGGAKVEFSGAGNDAYQSIGGLLSTGSLTGADYNWLASAVNIVVDFRNAQATWQDGVDNILTIDNINFSAVPEPSPFLAWAFLGCALLLPIYLRKK